MKVIGEKINGTLSNVRTAIETRDAEFIKNLAVTQIEAGVDWLDVNAGSSPEKELEDMLWLITCVQDVSDVPLCLDSANPEPLVQAVHATNKKPIINSISLEKKKIDEILPVVKENGCDVIALAMDDNGIPKNTDERLKIIDELLRLTGNAGIPYKKVYIDPLVMAAATNTESGTIALETIRETLKKYPEVHFCAGLSNISYGLPNRSIINQAFITLAISVGLDTAILNPLDKGLRGAILSAELLLGRDRHCQRYTKASKRGLVG
jgi:5-methyltetrahydrofolate corrinoid/iron sulfur protein methyltransferase